MGGGPGAPAAAGWQWCGVVHLRLLSGAEGNKEGRVERRVCVGGDGGGGVNVQNLNTSHLPLPERAFTPSTITHLSGRRVPEASYRGGKGET